MEEAEGQLKDRKRLKAVERHHGGMEKLGHTRGRTQGWDQWVESRKGSEG